jgi:hypothetical protein
MAPPHSDAVEFCCQNPAFTPFHIRTSGCQSAASLPKPCVQLLQPLITELFNKAATTKGETQREAAWAAVFLFPMLVSGPQKSGDASSAVKAEISARLTLWNIRQIDDLATRARSFKRPPLEEGRPNEMRGEQRSCYAKINLLERRS